MQTAFKRGMPIKGIKELILSDGQKAVLKWISIHSAIALSISLLLMTVGNIRSDQVHIMRDLGIFIAISIFLHSLYFTGLKHAFGILVIGYSVGLLAEHYALTFGIFGRYEYGYNLGDKLLNIPVIIPFFWYSLTYISRSIANCLLKGTLINKGPYKTSEKVFLTLLAGLIITGWDLVIEPYMVQTNAWTWKDGGIVFGIPWKNFLGWFLVSETIISSGWILEPLVKERKHGTLKNLLVPSVVFPYLFCMVGAIFYYLSSNNFDLLIISISVMVIPSIISAKLLFEEWKDG